MFDDVKDEMNIDREEIFGKVKKILRLKKIDEIIDREKKKE